MIRRRRLDHRVRDRVVDDHRAARQPQQPHREPERARGGEKDQQDAERRASHQHQPSPRADPSGGQRDTQGPDESADPNRRRERAVARRAAMQHVAREDRHHGDVGKTEDAQNRRQNHEDAEAPIVS